MILVSYYSCAVDVAHRSRMNVTFRIGGEDGNEALEKKFLDEAHNLHMIQLKGHRLEQKHCLIWCVSLLVDMFCLAKDKMELSHGKHAILSCVQSKFCDFNDYFCSQSISTFKSSTLFLINGNKTRVLGYYIEGVNLIWNCSVWSAADQLDS